MADQRALRVLDTKLLKLAKQNLGVTETVRVALKGQFGQALLALDDRILILKAGWMAGATLGGKATSFPYEQISAVELRVGPMTAVLQMQSSAFQAAQVGSAWSSAKNHNPRELPNCITTASAAAKGWPPYLDAIRARIARGQWPDESGGTLATTTPQPAHAGPPHDLPGQLAQLAELHESGALSAEQFEQAKQRLLSGS